MEGRQSTNPEWPRGPTPILPPTIDHLHTESSSITDGLTYYGKRLKELQGTHIYGDYDTGKFWGFRYENNKVVDHRELADTTLRVVTFGEDHDGEFYILDHPAGTINRLVPNPQPDQSSTFPKNLSESGLFSSAVEQAPAPGVVPYSITAPPWADHATGQRFVAIPDQLSINTAAAKWEFPKNSVLVKTLSLDMHEGDRSSSRRIETQILHYDGIEWMPYTYRWNDEQTDATLVGAAGAEQTFEIVDSSAPGGKRVQNWRFSGRAECQRCHNKWSGPALAFNSLQLDKTHGDLAGSQLDAFAYMQLFDKPVDMKKQTVNKELGPLADPYDASNNAEVRARSYLQVNCAHCHRMHAGGSVLSHMHFDLPLEKTNMIGARPSQGTFGIHDARVIAPGDPLRSVLLFRMAKLGGGRMPHIGSAEVDREAVGLMYDWIGQMSPDDGKENPKETADKRTSDNKVAAKLRREEATNLEKLKQSSTVPEQTEIVDRLLSRASGALLLLRAMDEREISSSVTSLIVSQAAQHSALSVRDLFERFLRPEQRVKRLGNVVQPEQILSLDGDAMRGKKVFFETNGVSCKSCHRIQKEGKDVGPELTAIGKKLSRVQLLESILQPSKLIDPKYVVHLVETEEGQVLTGLLVKKNADEVVLKDAQGKVHNISMKNIEQLVPQRQSLMPDLLVRDMTAQQVADLLAYLSSLK